MTATSPSPQAPQLPSTVVSTGLSDSLRSIKLSPDGFRITSIGDAEQVCALALASKYIIDPRTNTALTMAQATLKVLYGNRLNLDPLDALSNVEIIKGEPSVKNKFIANKIKSHPRYSYKVVKHDDDICRLECFEKDPDTKEKESLGFAEYTFKQAMAQGVTGNKPWQSDKQLMLFYKAIGRAYKQHFGDLFAIPVQSTEEMEEVLLTESLSTNTKDIAARVAMEIAHEKQEQSFAETSTEEVQDVDFTTTGESDAAAPQGELAIDSVVPSLNDKLEAGAAVQEALGNSEAAESIRQVAAHAEKVHASDLPKLTRAAAAKKIQPKALIDWICKSFELDGKTWQKELTTDQLAKAYAWIESQP